MQSHASRHVTSEFLKDLHPDLSSPFPKAVIADEISTAYGRRGVIKLIDVLALPVLSDTDRAHALRVFNSLLCTQEVKADATARGACVPLTHLINISASDEVRKLSCDALGSIAMIIPGRLAVHEAQGIDALTGALKKTPESAAGALKNVACSIDGAVLLHQYLDRLVPALVALMNTPEDGIATIGAFENAACALIGLTKSDTGIMAALAAHVPRCVVGVCRRGLWGNFKYEPTLMQLLESCASCLAQISHHPYGKTAIREADGIPVLSQMLNLGHRPTISFALSTLMGVSAEKESKMMVMQHGGQLLINVLRRENEELREKARQTIRNCVELLEARSHLGTIMSLDEQQELVFRGPLPPAPPDFKM